MELTGEHRIAAPRRVVWDALHDPELLRECIKGCKRLEMTGDDRMAATVEAKVGPVKATFDATVAIENSVAPERYTLTGEGKGGVAGFAKGSADVVLGEDGPDATILTYKADAKIGGKLAQLGQRLVDTTARKYAADFFDAFSAKLNAGAPPTAAVPGSATAAVPGHVIGDDAAELAARRADGTAAAMPELGAGAAPAAAIAPTAVPAVDLPPVRSATAPRPAAAPPPPHVPREAAREPASGTGRILVAALVAVAVVAAIYFLA